MKCDNYFQASQTRIVTDAANVWGGQKALEFTLPQSSTEVGNAVQKIRTNKYLIEFESWRGQASEPNPGLLNVYIYHPEQRSARREQPRGQTRKWYDNVVAAKSCIGPMVRQ